MLKEYLKYSLIIFSAVVWANDELEIPPMKNAVLISKTYEDGTRFANDVKITNDHPPHFVSKLDGEIPPSNISYCAFEAYYDTVYPAILIYKTTNGGLNWEFCAGIYNTSGVRLYLGDIAVTPSRVCISYVRDIGGFPIVTYSVPRNGGTGNFYTFPQSMNSMPTPRLSKKGNDETIDIAFNYIYSISDACIIYYRSTNGGINWGNEYSFSLGENHDAPSIYRIPGTNYVYITYYAWTLDCLKLSKSLNGGISFTSQNISNSSGLYWPVMSVSNSYVIVIFSRYNYSSSTVCQWSPDGGSTWNSILLPFNNAFHYDVCYGGNKFRAAVYDNVIKYKSATSPSEFSSDWVIISDQNAYPNGDISVCYLSNYGGLVSWWDSREPGGYSKIFCDAEGWVPGVSETENLMAKNVPFLKQNNPNPVKSKTTIEYILPKESKVSLKVLDITGKEITTLINGHQKAGLHQIFWNIPYEKLSSGGYFIQLTANDDVMIKKIIIIK